MTGLDWFVVVLYFALLAAITWWVVAQNLDTADDYFLAGRNLGWFVVGASIFATNIGSEHLLDGVTPDGELKPDARARVLAELRSHFRPEFLNRVDDIVLFKPLTLPEIERIVELMQEEGVGAGDPPPDAQLVAAGDAERRFGFKLVDQLRERLPGVRISLGSLAAGFKAQLRHADKSGARFALIVGDTELKAGKVALKPLRDGTPQRLVTVEECVDLLRQSLSTA